MHIHFESGVPSGDYTFKTVFGAVGTTGSQPIQPPPNMVSWWPGDGNAQDIVDGNHGILSGDATFAPGMVGQGFSLDGTGDFVLVTGDRPNLNITGDVTVDLWAKRTVFGCTSVLIDKGANLVGAADRPDAYAMWFSQDDHLVAGFARADGSLVFLVGPVVTDSRFHHYAYVRSGNTHNLLVDGVVATADTFTGVPGDASGLPLAIGAVRRDPNPPGFAFEFGGVIDEVEIFNRALTDAEIKAIYDAGSAGKRKPVSGDVNGDGVPDFIVGAYRDDPVGGGTDAGSAYVFSGADGNLLYQVTGDTAGDLFGYSVSIAGDVNGDGRADFIVGAYRDDPIGGGTDAGSAYVFSGPDGSLLYQLTGDTAGDHFGYSVSGAGDVNGDGRADFIVGAIGDNPGGLTNAGSAYVFSGADGSLLYQLDRRYRGRFLRLLCFRGWGRERRRGTRLHRGGVLGRSRRRWD